MVGRDLAPGVSMACPTGGSTGIDGADCSANTMSLPSSAPTGVATESNTSRNRSAAELSTRMPLSKSVSYMRVCVSAMGMCCSLASAHASSTTP